MDIYYFSEAYSKGKDAGNKARNDVDIVLSRKYKKLSPYDVKSQNRIYKAIKLLNTLISVGKSDIVIIQYPLPMGYNWLVRLITKLRRCIFIVHDLPYLRAENYSGEEIKKMRNAYYVVSHNEKMTEYMIEKGMERNKIQNLGVFDYIIPDEELTDHFMDKAILCYAGNLAKSEFIYNIPKKVTDIGVNVYGNNYIEDRNNQLNYCGSFDSEIIHKKIEGKFGLIWDGDSAQTCNGMFGKYMRYNNPHKISMYISAAMPVIIWKQAALADFVEKNKIGFAVEKIDDVYNIYQNFDYNEYKLFCDNIKKIREKIINGKMLEDALKNMLGE